MPQPLRQDVRGRATTKISSDNRLVFAVFRPSAKKLFLDRLSGEADRALPLSSTALAGEGDREAVEGVGLATTPQAARNAASRGKIRSAFSRAIAFASSGVS